MSKVKMTVVPVGNLPTQKYTGTCANCKTVFEAEVHPRETEPDREDWFIEPCQQRVRRQGKSVDCGCQITFYLTTEM